MRAGTEHLAKALLAFELVRAYRRIQVIEYQRVLEVLLQDVLGSQHAILVSGRDRTGTDLLRR